MLLKRLTDIALSLLVLLLLSPILASAAMTFSSVSVIANALRLRRSYIPNTRRGERSKRVVDRVPPGYRKF